MLASIIWLDAMLLRIVQKIANLFNMITGKDNFWLAKHVAFLGAIQCALQGYIEDKSRNFLLFLILINVYFFLSLIWIRTIKNLEKESEELQLKGLKRDFLLLFLWRLLVLSWFSVSIWSSTGRYPRPWLSVTGDLSFILIAYLVSLDKPPYNKSKVWEWLKQLGYHAQPSEVKT